MRIKAEIAIIDRENKCNEPCIALRAISVQQRRYDERGERARQMTLVIWRRAVGECAARCISPQRATSTRENIFRKNLIINDAPLHHHRRAKAGIMSSEAV